MAKSNSAAVGARDAPPRDRINGASKQGAWARLHERIVDTVDAFFFRLGYWVATRPKLTLLISLVLVVGCCFGFANFEIEADGEDLWVPAESLSKTQEDIVNTYFDESTDYALFLVESATEDANVLTKDSLDAIWEIDALVQQIEVDGKLYADICTTELDGLTCNQPLRGITRFWENDFANYEASVSSDADVLAAINVDVFPDGESVNLEAIFGNTLTYDDSGDVSGAKATTQTYELVSESDDDDDAATIAMDWMSAFHDLMEDQQDVRSDLFNLQYLTSRSIDDALEESVSSEIFLFVTTYVIMIAVVMLSLGRCCAGGVRRRSWLGLAGVGLVVAAGLAAYGLNSAFGIPFTSLSQILPFILIGIGVDDMFVIVAAYDHTDPSLPVEERVALGLKRCGLSITYTSLTNFAAFMLGSTTSLPAVEYFCLYAGTAILFDFFLQMTAFVAFLTMDANRQKAGRYDWCCCCKSKAYLENVEQDVQRGVSLPSGTLPDPRASGGLEAEVHEIGAVGVFMKEKYTPLLLSAPGKVIVLLGSAALLAAGIYGVTQATQGFDVLDLAPDDHYAREYTNLAREYELEMDTQYVPLGIYTREVDYPDVDVQAQIQATDALMESQRYVIGPVDSWLASFVEWAANGTEYSANVGTSGGYAVYDDRDTFYTALGEFVAEDDNSRFLDDLAFTESGDIELYLIDLTDTDSNVDALEDARDVVEESSLDPEPFAFSSVFVFTEQYLVIYDELILNFILALAAVAVLSLLVLGKVGVVALVCITVVIIDAELLGFVYHWGLDVNSITVIELIMAVGLVVDYMVHIVHYFLHQDPTIPKDARISDALGEIGPSVMVGACTTFLGIMPLAFASNVIFRVFFRMFLIIISFGFFHGVVFIPVMLSILPDCCVSKRPSRADALEAKGAPVTVNGAGVA